MRCPHCRSIRTKERSGRTELGYQRFRCGTCKRVFNERTGTLFNRLQYPTDDACLVVLWRLRYKLSLRDLSEMFLIRGMEFTHEAVRNWEARLAPYIAQGLRKGRRGRVGESWYIDETCVNVGGQWTYLYRAIDRNGNLIDVRLSETRDMTAAKTFFAGSLEVAGRIPDRITSDGHDAYPAAIRGELGSEVIHRTNQYLNNHLEQDHRGIKQRYYPTGGFKSFASASRFCRAFDELRNFLRPQRRRCQHVSLTRRRFIYICRVGEIMGIMEAAAN